MTNISIPEANRDILKNSSTLALYVQINLSIKLDLVSVNGPREIYFVDALRADPVVQWLSYPPLDPRFAGSNPASVDGYFQSVKIPSMISFGREVKPLVPCRKFTARNRTSSRN